MKINVIEKRNNILLDRVDVIFEIEEDNVTPKRLDVKAKLAALINHDENLVIIKEIQQKTGVKKSKGLAHAYKTIEQLNRIEPKYLIKRNSPKPPPGEEAKEEETEKK